MQTDIYIAFVNVQGQYTKMNHNVHRCSLSVETWGVIPTDFFHRISKK